MNNNYKRKPLSLPRCLLLAGCIVLPSFAAAQLYVSPVVRDTVNYNGSKNIVSSSGNILISGSSTVHGDFFLGNESKDQGELLRYGRNVPLFVAIEHIVPSKSGWNVNLDKGLENVVVNWDGGNSWEGVIMSIASENNLTAIINNEEKAVGVSRDNELAEHLAHRTPSVWYLEDNLSLKDNLSKWCQRAGWTLSWEPKIDYPINHRAIITGEFVGKDGAVDKVLFSFRSHPNPLTATFYNKNQVLRITEAGFRQEVK